MVLHRIDSTGDCNCDCFIGQSIPDALSTSWRRVGRGAIISAARVSVDTYERSGRVGLAAYLQNLAVDSDLHSQLVDSNGHGLNGPPSPDLIRNLARLSSQPEERLILLGPPETAAVRIRGPSGSVYSFFTTLPARTERIVWSPRINSLLCLVWLSVVLSARPVPDRANGPAARVDIPVLRW